MKKQIVTAVMTGIVVFALVFATRMLITNAVPGISVFVRQVVLEIMLALVSIAVAIKMFRIPAADLNVKTGFLKKATALYYIIALAMGMMATTAMLLFALPGIPSIKDLNPLQHITVVLMASISEELMARGLVQGIVKEPGKILLPGKLPVSGGTLAGAIVFSLIHFSIFIVGGNIATCLTIMLFAFFLGLAAGVARERAKLGAAITTHMAFNIGGIAAGILINIGAMLLTGHMITHA